MSKKTKAFIKFIKLFTRGYSDGIGKKNAEFCTNETGY